MTVFQTRPSTLTKLHTFPAFQSYEAYMTGKKPVSAMGQSSSAPLACLRPAYS